MGCHTPFDLFNSARFLFLGLFDDLVAELADV